MIPVFRPVVGPEEIEAVTEVLRSGWWGLGPKTREFEECFAAAVGAAGCVGTSSGTAALELSLATLDLAGREVVTPSLTFVSTSHAILHQGGKPVFADVDPVTLTLDPADVERRLTRATAAIMVVHYGGHPADMDRLSDLAAARGLAIVEDAAHATGARYRGRPVGSLSTLTCFSFQAVKNVAMGEGGAITTSDLGLAGRLRRLRWLGLDRDTWTRAESGTRYSWDYDLAEVGYKAHLSDIPAAIGLVQLARLPGTNARRRAIAGQYAAGLADVPWLELPTEQPWAESAWHMFVVRVPDRDRFIGHLAERGVASSVHYRPNHLYGPYRRYATFLPVTERVWPTLVTLPLFPGLVDDEVEQIIQAVRSFRPAPHTTGGRVSPGRAPGSAP